MRKQYYFLNSNLFWVMLAMAGFALLPSMALYYGIFDSTQDEILSAMGWSSVNLSWVWFGSLFLIPIFSFLYKGKGAVQQGKIEFLLACLIFSFVMISASIEKFSLGYSEFILTIALIGISTNALAKMKVMQSDKFVIASLLSIVLLIFFFIVYPTLAIFISMFYKGDEFVPGQVLDIVKQPYVIRIILNSLAVAGTIGILATAFGLVFALYTTRIAKRSAVIGKIFSILPIVTPPFVVGLGVTLMLGRSGYITHYLVEYLGFESNWLYGFTGIVIAHTLALTPMSFMILEGALKSIHPSIEEAAYTLRANRYQTFFNIIFPLLKPALANSFLVVAIQSIADFSTPLVLGGSFDVISSQIYFYIAGSQLDYASASTLGTILLIFSLGIFIIQYWWIGNRSYTTVSGKSYRGDVQDLPVTMKYAITFILAFWIIFNVLLYGSIFYGSFTVNWGVDYTLTLKNYITLFGQGFSDGAWPSLIQTVIFAATAAPITALFGLLIAYITVRREFKGKKTLEFLTLLCFAVPGTVAGVSYILAFNDAPIYITGTALIVILSMVMRNMPVGMRAAIAGLGQLDKSLDEASLSLKGSSFKTICFIVFPLLKPALLSALVTSFVRAMTTVSAIVFLVTADTRVATSYILNPKSFGKSTVIDNLDLTIKRGTMVTLLGPSGCGKTTVLRLVAGLENPTSGQIFIDGEDVTKSSIQNRDICIVFQSYALFPHMSIGDNVGYGLRMQGVGKEERAKRVKEALELVDLAGFEDRFVDQISGGQQQRVALARALVLKPKVLLFDEPLSNLDANLRRSMREKIRELQQSLGITSLYVTHDQTEAFAVSDEVIVMNKGKIMQKAPAKELYLRPNSLFLANFMGESSILDGECLVGVRPEAIYLKAEGEAAQQCEIKSAVYMGNHWEVVAIWAGKELLINTKPEDFNANLKQAYVNFSEQGIFLLKKEQ